MKKITTQNKLQEVVREREGLGVSPLHKLAPAWPERESRMSKVDLLRPKA